MYVYSGMVRETDKAAEGNVGWGAVEWMGVWVRISIVVTLVG